MPVVAELAFFAPRTNLAVPVTRFGLSRVASPSIQRGTQRGMAFVRQAVFAPAHILGQGWQHWSLPWTMYVTVDETSCQAPSPMLFPALNPGQRCISLASTSNTLTRYKQDRALLQSQVPTWPNQTRQTATMNRQPQRRSLRRPALTAGAAAFLPLYLRRRARIARS
jgi:hypothetical protein